MYKDNFLKLTYSWVALKSIGPSEWRSKGASDLIGISGSHFDWSRNFTEFGVNLVTETNIKYLHIFTTDLRTGFPDNGRSCGAARKGMNLFWREVVYNYYLLYFLKKPTNDIDCLNLEALRNLKFLSAKTRQQVWEKMKSIIYHHGRWLIRWMRNKVNYFRTVLWLMRLIRKCSDSIGLDNAEKIQVKRQSAHMMLLHWSVNGCFISFVLISADSFRRLGLTSEAHRGRYTTDFLLISIAVFVVMVREWS
jgi:hypothetical protein